MTLRALATPYEGTTPALEAYDVIVAGHLCLDLFPDLSGVDPAMLGRPGTLAEAGPLSVATGGAVSNTGLALARLGARVGLMATVGDDAIGTMTKAYLDARDPRLTRLVSVRRGLASSYSVVLAPGGRDRSFLHHAGPNATFGVDDVDFRAVGRARMFHLGYPPLMPRLLAQEGEELREIFSRAKNEGAVTSMDMVVPDPGGPSGAADWDALLARVLPSVDVFIPSLDEALFMLRRSDFEAWRGDALARIDRAYLASLCGELLDRGAVIAGLKLGEAGLYLRTASETSLRRLERLPLDATAWARHESWQPAYEVEVAGTTGAGDSAYAGFLAGMLRGLPPYACAQMACAVGACNVEKVDATSGVRTWQETVARIEARWPARPLPHFSKERADAGSFFQ